MTTRRSFLRTLGLALASAPLTPELVLADPYRARVPRSLSGAPLRVRGRVTARGRGLAGVAVSDGLQVVETGADGGYEMVSDQARDFVFISTPAGYRVGRTGTGTAAFYRPLPGFQSGLGVARRGAGAGGASALPGPGRDGVGARRGGSADTVEASFDLEPLEVADERHAVLMLPDIQTQDAWEMGRFHAETVPDVAATVAALSDREVVGISCGDIMFDDLALYPEYERGVRRMGVPFFQCVGNHDLDFDGATDEATTATFSRHFGPRYYSFDRGAVHYVVLDDVLWHGQAYIGYLDYAQLVWLEQDLARVEPGRPVVVALHIPVEGTGHLRNGEESPGDSVSVNNREVLYRLLEPYQAHIVAGHTHENDHLWRQGVHEHVSGTVCGAWWSGHICGDGTPNGYAVYEVAGETITWRYKATGRPDDHQMRVYPRGSEPGAPQEIVANVWDADEGWRVVWYEDGDRRGLMARRRGVDPRSVAEHTGEDLPEHRPWVDPYVTGHLYFAPVPPEHGTITVEATDRFGRTYRETLPGTRG